MQSSSTLELSKSIMLFVDRRSTSFQIKNCDMTPQTDYTQEQKLVAALKESQDSAVRVWYTRYKPKISSYISLKVSSKEDVEELVGFTFMDCLKQLPLYLGQSSLFTWMISIAKHIVADYYRKLYAKKAVKTLPLINTLIASPVVDAQETSAQVTSVLQKMSAASKELLLQKYIDKKKVAHIAAKFGKSVKAIESELFRARKEFKLLFIKESESS